MEFLKYLIMESAFFLGCAFNGVESLAPPIFNPENTTADFKQVFLLAGQSNMQGAGDSLLSPSPNIGNGFQYSVANNNLIHLQDPLIFDGIRGTPASRDANTGTLVSPFAKKYNEISGNKVMAYSNTPNFHTLGWMNGDNLHYNQSGLNDIGNALGAFVNTNL